MLSLHLPSLGYGHCTDNRCWSPRKTGKPNIYCFSTFLIKKAKWYITKNNNNNKLSPHPVSKHSLDKTNDINKCKKKHFPHFKMCPCGLFSILITNFLLMLASYWFGFAKILPYFLHLFSKFYLPKTKPKENKYDDGKPYRWRHSHYHLEPFPPIVIN